MRLFFSVPLPEAALESLRPVLEGARKAAGAGIGFTRLEQLHFTLAFLGGTERIDDASAAAEGVRDLAQFDLAISGRGAFPGMSRPRVLWLGVTEGGAALSAVAGKLCSGLRERGFALEDRAFHPHLTLGRVKPHGAEEARRALEAVPKTELARFTAREIVLVESVLGTGGSTHKPLRSFSLRAL
jgi:2'-5' RNA ligase